MIPISDENPARLTPFVTWGLIAACVAVFFWQILGFSEDQERALILTLAFVPQNLFNNAVTYRLAGIPWPWLTLLTSMFLHGGFLHLGGNMLYLWIFGNNVEDAMGHMRYFLFYLGCGVVAALTQGIMTPDSDVPMLGASGAISGVLASYVLIYPKARVNVIIPLGILLYPAKISAFYVVGFWFLLQLLNIAMTAPGAPGTAWGAHIGGFVVGLLLTPMLSNFPLFGRRTGGPWG
jgi:membrane associated rhomboid family serine protease